MVLRKSLITLFVILCFNSALYSAEPEVTEDSTKTNYTGLIIFDDELSVEGAKQNNYEGTNDIIHTYSGMDINETSFPGHFSSVNYRGKSHKGITLSIDEIPIESNLFGIPDLNRIPLEFFESLRFSRKSSFTPGYLNIDFQPKLPGDRPLTRIVYRIGDFERSFFDTYLSRKIGSSTDLGLFGNFESYPGQYGDDNYIGRRFYGFFKRRLSNNIEIKFQGMYTKRGGDVPNSTTFSDQLEFHNARTDNNSDFYSFNITKDTEKELFDVFLYYNKYKRTFRVDKSKTDAVKSKEGIIGAGVNYKRKLADGDVNLRGTVSAYTLESDSIYNLSSFEYNNKTKYSAEGNYRYFLKENLILVPSVSLYYDAVRGTITSGGIWLYNQIGNSLLCYTSYSIKGRYPSLIEQFKRELDKEVYNTFEAGVRYTRGNSLIRAALYNERINYFIFQYLQNDYPMDEFSYSNEESLTFWGAELSGNLYFSDYLEMYFNYNYSGNRKSEKYLYNPEAGGKLSLIINNIHNIVYRSSLKSKIRISCLYRNAENLKNFNSFYRDFIISPYLTDSSLIFNLKASATLYDATIFYEVDNLFGENYIDVYGFPVPKTTIRMGVQWDFFN
ncbi:TonB-dependent receptor plug domain-containing protein [candidate division KSB1 bacterium]